VPKHRRSESDQAPASVGAPMRTVEFWPEPDGYGPATATGRPMNGHAGFVPAGNGSAASTGESAAVAEPGWAAALDDGRAWQELQDWHDWGPPPVMHPDHPSAPVPRIELSPDHPSGSWSYPAARRTPDLPRRPAPDLPHQRAADLPQRRLGTPGPGRTRSAPPREPDSADRSRHRRLNAVRGFAPGADYVVTGPPARGHPGRHGRQNGDSLLMAGQILSGADGQAAHIARRAQADAAAMLEAAARDAAAIREAAQQDAAEMRTRLDSMLSELGRVAAFLTESYAIPALPATAPAFPGSTPDLREPRSAPPAAIPMEPDTEPEAGPDARPGTRRARPVTGPHDTPARPGTRSVGPARPVRTTPAKKPQNRPRQQRAMRIASYTTAALVSFALIFGATEIGLHGFKFFVFRESGQGQSTDGPTDQQFLTQQTAAHHQAPTGRHHKTSP
jgi:hypothetical protein